MFLYLLIFLIYILFFHFFVSDSSSISTMFSKLVSFSCRPRTFKPVKSFSATLNHHEPVEINPHPLTVSFEDISRAHYRIESGVRRTVRIFPFCEYLDDILF